MCGTVACRTSWWRIDLCWVVLQCNVLCCVAVSCYLGGLECVVSYCTGVHCIALKCVALCCDVAYWLVVSGVYFVRTW